ncbi:MAG: hypothetical protein EHM55_00785 [Acidobacteria bacterium]|nr:MAG: hypothetical protein EHM55_00785 [Acidobacteriota bacterium]
MTTLASILVDLDAVAADHPALEQAVRLAARCGARVKIVDVLPRVPAGVRHFVTPELEKELIDHRRGRLTAIADSVEGVSVTTELLRGRPGIALTQEILRSGHDLLVRSHGRDLAEGSKPFGAIDMELLRQCPCPVWLIGRRGSPSARWRILAAIHANPSDAAEQELNGTILDWALTLKAVRRRGTDTVASVDALRRQPPQIADVTRRVHGVHRDSAPDGGRSALRFHRAIQRSADRRRCGVGAGRTGGCHRAVRGVARDRYSRDGHCCKNRHRRARDGEHGRTCSTTLAGFGAGRQAAGLQITRCRNVAVASQRTERCDPIAQTPSRRASLMLTRRFAGHRSCGMASAGAAFAVAADLVLVDGRTRRRFSVRRGIEPVHRSSCHRLPS